MLASYDRGSLTRWAKETYLDGVRRTQERSLPAAENWGGACVCEKAAPLRKAIWT